MADLVLTHAHITQALLSSTDGGETLDLTKWGFDSISDSSVQELSRIGTHEDDDVGIVTR
jgi:hypothetical protein